LIFFLLFSVIVDVIVLADFMFMSYKLMSLLQNSCHCVLFLLRCLTAKAFFYRCANYNIVFILQ